MSGKAAGGLVAAVGLGGVVLIVALGAVVGAPKDAFAGGVGGDLKPGTVPDQYSAMVAAAGSQCPAAPPAIIAAQLNAESGFNPKAVSPVGAQGISQFMPGTWALYGRDENGDGTADPFDPADAIPAQGRYDCQLAADLTPALTAGKVSGPVAVLVAPVERPRSGHELGDALCANRTDRFGVEAGLGVQLRCDDGWRRCWAL